MHTATETLQEQVRRVAEARRVLEERKAAFGVKEKAFLDENADLTKQVVLGASAVAQAESALRALVLAHYEMTKEKKPVAGVEVKIKSGVEYDAKQAFAWAKEKGIAIVPEALDEDAFEKVIGALPVAPDFVRFTEKPEAQIAKNLEKALATVAA